MAPALTADSYEAQPTLPVSPVSSAAMATGSDGQGISPQDLTSAQGPARSGSPVSQDGLDAQDAAAADAPDGLNDASPASDGPARKRRRSRKGLSKRFECKEVGCGKSYSRAEHLYVEESSLL